MYIIPIEFGTPDYDAAVALRYAVLRAPLGLHYTPEQLAVEWNEHHLAAFTAGGQLIAYLNLHPLDPDTVKMRQVAVSPECQGRGVGKALVAASEVMARTLGHSRMVLHARLNAVPFYEKLDYKRVGEPFEEVTLPHFRMEKNL